MSSKRPMRRPYERGRERAPGGFPVPCAALGREALHSPDDRHAHGAGGTAGGAHGSARRVPGRDDPADPVVRVLGPAGMAARRGGRRHRRGAHARRGRRLLGECHHQPRSRAPRRRLRGRGEDHVGPRQTVEPRREPHAREDGAIRHQRRVPARGRAQGAAVRTRSRSAPRAVLRSGRGRGQDRRLLPDRGHEPREPHGAVRARVPGDHRLVQFT